MGYDQPDKGVGFSPSEHPEWLGHLFLIWPTECETVIYTKPDGTPDPTDVVTADVAIITLADPQTGKPVFLKNARIGGKALTKNIKRSIGSQHGKCLGKLVSFKAQKGIGFALDRPDIDTPQGQAEWQQMTSLAEQYEAQFPHVNQTYEQPATNGQQAWNATSTAQPAMAGTAPVAQGVPAWQQGMNAATQSTAQTAPAWQQQQMQPTASTPTAGPNPVSTPQAGWNAQPAAAPAPWPPGLREFLESKGENTQGMTEAKARELAHTYQTQNQPPF